MKVTILTTLLFLNVISLAQATSFDCNQAQTVVENLICTYPRLSEIDERLNATYTEALKSLPTTQANQLREKQRTWLEKRDQHLKTACVDQTCLTDQKTVNACFQVNCAVQFYAEQIALLKDDSSPTTNLTLLPPSFDCTKAETAVEQMICDHTLLSDVDGRLGKIYTQLKAASAIQDKNTLQAEQRAWLEKRDMQLIHCAKNMDCALKIYTDRIEALQAQLTLMQSSLASITGQYANQNLTLQVTTLLENHVHITIEGAEPTDGKWICQFSEVGTLETDTVSVCHPEHHTPILFTFSKAHVQVTGDYLKYFCGGDMTIAGQYVKQ